MASQKRVSVHPRLRRRRAWREYKTAQGTRPVKDFLDGLNQKEKTEVVAAMKEVRDHGVARAKHLRGSVYEVVANTADHWYRILFAPQGHYSHVLLSLHAFAKKTNATPAQDLDLAERRLRDWLERGKYRKAQRKQARKGKR
jgi:phage-related protein